MSDEKKTNPDLKNEFKNLGESIQNLFNAAWDSEERRKLQQELEEGIDTLSSTIHQTAEEMKASQAGQQFKHDMEDLSGRWQSGELSEKVRAEVQNALRLASEGLNQAADGLSKKDKTPPGA